MDSKYYFDIDFLLSLDLYNKKYSLDYIINRIINYNKFSNNLILNTIILKSKKSGKLNLCLLKKNIKSFIIKDYYKKPPKYLDLGNKIKSIML